MELMAGASQVVRQQRHGKEPPPAVGEHGRERVTEGGKEDWVGEGKWDGGEEMGDLSSGLSSAWLS